MIAHAQGTATPEDRPRTVIGIHGPRTETYGTIELEIRDRNFRNVTHLFYTPHFWVNLEGKSNIGHCFSNKDFTKFVSDEVQPLVPDIKIDTLIQFRTFWTFGY